MGEPRIDAPRTVDQLAWWVQHGEEQRLEIETLRSEIQHLAAVLGWAEPEHNDGPVVGRDDA